MASTPLTLAALATSAVPGLEVEGTREHTSGSGGAFTSAVLATNLGEVIIRVPANAAAEVQQSSELLGISAFSEGVRERLPFAVPATLGMTRAGDTRAVASVFLSGEPVGSVALHADTLMSRSVGESIAAIHSLPSTMVQQAGLPMRTSEEVRLLVGRLVRRATDTGVLPATVRQRWQDALDTGSLWSFEATPVHGSLDADHLLVSGDIVTGVLGWGDFALGDPATDLGWLFTLGEDAFSSVVAHYSVQRGLAGVRELTARARLHYELDVARWLLHGVETHDQEIIDDAVRMLDRLVDSLNLLGAPLPEQPVLNEEQVEQLLERTPELPDDPRSETAEYEALDDDRVFDADEDFRSR